MPAFTAIIILSTALAFWGNQLVDSLWMSYLPLLLMLGFLLRPYRLVIIFVSSFLWASLQFQGQVDRILSDEFEGQTLVMTASVIEITQQRHASARLLVKPESIQGYDKALPERIRLSWYRNSQFPQLGERWQLRVKLRKPDGFQNPGGFDYQRWLFTKGIGATGYIRDSTDNKRLESTSAWRIDFYRLALFDAIRKYCGDCQSQSLFQALAIGYRGDIQADQNQRLRDTGTSHLLAISGLHIGLVAGLFFALGRVLWRVWFYRYGLNRLEFAALLGFSAALAYSALAGFSLPTLRALVMLAVVIFALLFRRGINLLNSTAIAASLILIVDPLAIGAASFWLSIGALLVIALGQYLMQSQRSLVKRLLLIQWLFSLLFVPLTLILFGQASTVGFFANLLAIPLVSFLVLPLVLVASLLAALDLSMASLLFKMADSLTVLLMSYLDALLRFGVQFDANKEIPLLLLLCATIGLLLLVLPLNASFRKPGLILLCLSFFWRPVALDEGEFRLSVLDVGMGTSVVVETRNHSLVYDFGPGNDSGYSSADWVLKPYLRYRAIESPDLMVISHVDQDHSGGFVSYLDEYDSARLISGTPTELMQRFKFNHSVRSCHTFPAWQWDGIGFEFFAGESNEWSKTTNNRSCVLKITGLHSALLSGDIEADREQSLIAGQAQQLQAEILLVPHHGSLTSSSEAFLRQVMPEVAIFTLSRNNRWGFPKADVLSRYENLGSKIYRSDRDGAIILSSRAKGLHVEGFRRHGRRIWQSKD